VLLLLTLIIAGLGAYGVGVGLSSHGDSRAIVENSIPAILHGSYVPSRSLGVPLYEVVSALLYRATGSLRAINYYSLVVAVAALFVFAGLLDRSLGATRRALVLAGFALNPLMLINSSALIEWMQIMLLLLVLLASAKAWLDHRQNLQLVGYGLSSTLLVLTRPDMVVMCTAVLLALLWETRSESRFAVELIASSIVAGLLTAAIFLTINHGIDFVHGYSPSSDTRLRRIAVAAMGAANVFGPLGLVAITLLAFHLAHEILLHERHHVSWWGRLLLVAGPLFILRFVILPAKLEYLLPLVPVALLAVAHERLGLLWVAVVASSLILTSAVCVSLFKRTVGVDRISVEIDVHRGALAQEWEVTRHYQLISSQRILHELADLVYAGEPAPRPQLHAVNYAIGVLSDENDLIIGEEQLYRLDNQRFPRPQLRRRSYRRIYVCSGSISGIVPGWRVWQRPPTLPFIDPTTNHLTVRCWEEGSANDENVDH
jgi:hypothetical protein